MLVFQGQLLSSKLETLEQEIISQRAISSILLDKVKSTFQNPSQGANADNSNINNVKKEEAARNNANYDYNEVADKLRERDQHPCSDLSQSAWRRYDVVARFVISGKRRRDQSGD